MPGISRKHLSPEYLSSLWKDEKGEVYKLRWYCLSPTVTLENIVTGQQKDFGINGLSANDFTRLVPEGENIAVAEDPDRCTACNRKFGADEDYYAGDDGHYCNKCYESKFLQKRPLTIPHFGQKEGPVPDLEGTPNSSCARRRASND